MAVAQSMDYVKPKTLDEAVAALAEHGAQARVLAGGTDLVNEMTDGLRHPRLLVDIKGIPELDQIAFADGVLSVGACVTFTDLAESDVVREAFPLITEMVHFVSCKSLRNRATMVGNICSAIPCCDSGPMLQVYEAEVRLAGPEGPRAVPIMEWFLGPRKTAARGDEIVTALAIRRPTEKHAGSFVKLRRYRGEDLAQASVTTLALEGDRYRISFGSVAPTPVRGLKIEALLDGQPLDEALLERARALVAKETAPITDIRASKEYRALMLEVMLERGLRAAASRLTDGGPAYGADLMM